MPSKLPTISTVLSGYQGTETINNNFESLRNAFQNTLSRDGQVPNSMDADLDLNGYDIINASGLYINGVDILALLNRITISTASPTGGSEGDIWFKVSS